MVKIISFFLSLLLGLYSFAGGFYNACVLPGTLGKSSALRVREKEASEAQYPEPGDYKVKEFVDDTGDDFVIQPEYTLNAQTWVANEITLESTKLYNDPFNDVDVDLVLVGNGVKYTVPGFWAGENKWKIRFVCPTQGEWLFKTLCTDAANDGLDGRTGKVNCTKYSGEYDIYKHGFVTAKDNKKYLTYADSTPFFYLGDTHWSLGDETVDMVEEICKKRSEQGFTVFQSEPIGALFDVANGVTQADMPGFEDYDKKFAIIAKYGLTHANAEFFFPYSMQVLIDCFGGISADGTINEKALNYLEKLSRYWVARYSAYPVLWTLGQEVDRDFYSSDTSSHKWNFKNNPYKLVAEYIYRYDAYSHPLTAHQENSGVTGAYASGDETDEKLVSYYGAHSSAFRDVPSHCWYAVQWSPTLVKKQDSSIPKDYWYNSQGKPSINYEGRYDGLWTKNFGSRMQGWASYLSGMFGYGWGAHDTWSYLNIYDENNDSSDGVDTITSAEKTNATWRDALEKASARQMGYMKEFFTCMNWWELVPRFDDKRYFKPSPGVYYYAASNSDNSQIVIYFYSFSDSETGEKSNTVTSAGYKTGTVGSLEPDTVYNYKWFDPQSGEFSAEGQFTSTSFGKYAVGLKQFNGENVNRDMVLYIYK